MDSLLTGARRAQGFTGTIQQVTPAATSDIEFTAANGGTMPDGSPSVAAVDLSVQDSLGSAEFDVRSVEVGGRLFVGAAATVRSIVGSDAAGGARWLRLDATDPAPGAGFYAVARQQIELTDPYRYLALALRATAVQTREQAVDVSTARLTLAPADFRAAFPHLQTGVPLSPDTITVDVSYAADRHLLQRVDITLTSRPRSGEAAGVWTIGYAVTSTARVRIESIDHDFVVAPTVG